MDTVSKVIPRKDWKAILPTRKRIKLQLPVSILALTFTETDTCSSKEQCVKIIKALQEKQMTYVGAFDIHYNFLIGGDGEVYEGCGWNYVAKVSKGHRGYYRDLNGKAVLVAYIGPRDIHISDPMKLAVYYLKHLGIAEKKLERDVKLVLLPEAFPETDVENNINDNS